MCWGKDNIYKNDDDVGDTWDGENQLTAKMGVVNNDDDEESWGDEFSLKNKGLYVCQCSVIEFPISTIFLGLIFSELFCE